MNQLKCTTINCQHNLKDHCNAVAIGINNKGVCESKIRRAGGALEQSFAEIEAADDFLQSAPTVIECSADCVYKKDNKCNATSILVADNMLKTRCMTKIKPKQ